MSETPKHKVVFGKLCELRQAILDLENSREKSTMLTKVDEIRHWNQDGINRAQRSWPQL